MKGSANASMPQRKNLLEQFKERLEPSVAGPTIVNDGSIFMALGIWYAHILDPCAFQQGNTQKKLQLDWQRQPESADTNMFSAVNAAKG